MARLVKRLALSLGVLGALVVGAELYLRNEGYGAIPNVWFDPDMGTRFHPSQTRKIYVNKLIDGKRVLTFLSDATINAQGFRDKDFDDARVARARRIACVGDSFTFGWGVGDDDAYPQVLHRLLDAGDVRGRWQVMNFGMPGYNTWQELRLYEKAVRPWKPEVVVIGWYMNDLDPFGYGATGSLSQMDHPLAGTALLDWYVRKARPVKPNFVFNGLDTEVAQGLKGFYDQNTTLFDFDAGDERARPYVERNLGHLGQLVAAIQADGARPVLLVFPSAEQVVDLETKQGALSEADYAARRAAVTRIQRDLAGFAAERGILHVDLLETFLAGGPGTFDDVDLSHPGEHGHRLTAEALQRALAEAGAL